MTPITQDTENNKVVVRELQEEIKQLVPKLIDIREKLDSICKLEATRVRIDRDFENELEYITNGLSCGIDTIYTTTFPWV